MSYLGGGGGGGRGYFVLVLAGMWGEVYPVPVLDLAGGRVGVPCAGEGVGGYPFSVLARGRGEVPCPGPGQRGTPLPVPPSFGCCGKYITN